MEIKVSIESHLVDFLEYLSLKNYRPTTIESRKFSIYFFIRFLNRKNIESITNINEEIVTQYKVHIQDYRKKDGGKLSVSRKRTHLISANAFFKYLLNKNLILNNPFASCKLPKKVKALPADTLTPNEVVRILSVPDVSRTAGLRDRAILEVFYSSGVRRNELVNIQLNDFDFGRGLIVIREGKGGKQRLVPVGESAMYWVKRYIDKARILLDRKKISYLFLSIHGEKIKKDTLTITMRGYIKKSGVKKKGSCHIFRHTMATQMLKNGADIRYIQEILGHVSLSTTEVYTRVEIKKLQENYNRFFPIID